jgi:ubiquitin carboxyl-terminal hydrolase 5/13
MEWMLGHLDDADLNDALPDPSAATPAAASTPTAYTADPESVMMLTSMGFTERQVGPISHLC